MNIVCIRDYIAPACRYTAGKTYQVIDDNQHSIQIVDDDGYQVALTKEHIGLGFDYHFKYLSEVRHSKLESLGI